MSTNEITGASLVTKASSEAYREGWDSIFSKKEDTVEDKPKKQILLLNQAACNICNEVITSRFTHDFVSCYCGNLHVDGGSSYTKRSFTTPDYIELSIYAAEDDIETIRKYFSWGSRGKEGDEPLRHVLLKDMELGHIQAILRTQAHIYGTPVEKFFNMEVKYREMLYDKELQYRKDNNL